MTLELDPEEMQHVSWGKPDSPRRPFCGRCHAYLSDDAAPLMLFREDGSCISLCQPCVDKIVRVKP